MTVAEILSNIWTAKARIKEIHSSIHEDVTQDVTLSDLDSTSKTSDFSLWESIVATISYIQDQLFNQRKAEIQEIVDRNVSPNGLWLSYMIKQFQYGDDLIFDEKGKPAYALVDEEKQIVTYVSIIESAGFYYAKVAKDNNGNPEALTADELSALNAYLNLLILGNNGLASSKAADLAQVKYTIYFNAVRGKDVVQEEVETAIRNYLAALNFKGEMLLSKLEDAIQSIADVYDLERDEVLMKAADAIEFVSVNRIYTPEAGYVKVDPDNDLSSTLTFVAI